MGANANMILENLQSVGLLVRRKEKIKELGKRLFESMVSVGGKAEGTCMEVKFNVRVISTREVKCWTWEMMTWTCAKNKKR